jgi:hypothetical protein
MEWPSPRRVAVIKFNSPTRDRELGNSIAAPSGRNPPASSSRAAVTVAPAAGGGLERQPFVIGGAEVCRTDGVAVSLLEELPFPGGASRRRASGAVNGLRPALVGPDLGSEAYLGRS